MSGTTNINNMVRKSRMYKAYVCYNGLSRFCTEGDEGTPLIKGRRIANLITEIKPQKGRRARLNIFLNGTYALSVDSSVVVEAGIAEGMELSEAEIEELKQKGLFADALNRAISYLSYRPRSEREIQRQLHRRNFSQEVIEKVLARLKEQGLVDDIAFAEFWKGNREAFSPRSRRLVEQELRLKGVPAEVAKEVSQGMDDKLSALAAGRKKARSLKGLEYPQFRKRLSDFLHRRGFGYEDVRHAVERLWEEKEELPL